MKFLLVLHQFVAVKDWGAPDLEDYVSCLCAAMASDNGLLPGLRQAIIWSNAVEPGGTTNLDVGMITHQIHIWQCST